MNKITIAMLSIFTIMLFVSGVIAAETTTAINARSASAVSIKGVPAIKVSPDTSAGANIKTAPTIVKGAFAKPVTVGSAAQIKIVTVTTATNEVIPIYRATSVGAINRAIEAQIPGRTPEEADVQNSASAVYVKTNGITKVITFGSRQIKVPSFFPSIKFAGAKIGNAVNLQVVDVEGNKVSETTIAEGVEKTFSGIKVKPVSITSASDIQLTVSAE